MAIISSTMSNLAYLCQIINQSENVWTVCHNSFKLYGNIFSSRIWWMECLIWNNCEVSILFPLSVSQSHFPLQQNLAISITMTTRSGWDYPLYLTNKLAAVQLSFGWNNLKRDRITFTEFCLGKHNLTHQATDFLFGLISWCFVSGVDIFNEQNGEIFNKGL